MEFIPEKKYMEEALALAKIAGEEGEIPVGAVLVMNGEILGRGRNSREKHKDPLGHAEIAAISEAAKNLGDWRLTDSVLYVTLEPCPMCAGAIINSRVGRVVFGCEDDKLGACGTVTDLFALPNTGNPKIFRNFMEDECRGILRDFFKKLR